MSDRIPAEATEGLPAPTLVLAGPAMHFPAMPSPEQIVFTYDPDQFEVFVKEWVPALNEEYVRVSRHGGTGDHGIDVAGYLTPQGLEGDWHNYQCKRYKGPVSWSVAAAEIRKMFAGAALGHFITPTQYIFVAPQISRSLRQDFDRPSATRTKFLDELARTTDPIITRLTPEARRKVDDLAADTEFSIFSAIDLGTMIEQHKKTPHWVTRFPPERRQRPAIMQPPPEHATKEAQYVQKLVQVYAERWGEPASTLEQAAAHGVAGAHLRRQREAFYSAESLRRFARDAYPEGHFEAILDDIDAIVGDIAAGPFKSGWERMDKVITEAGSVQLTETVLTCYVRPLDRKGVCHHLANEDRLTWCEGGET
ncbi:ABC-three component system protein [Kitasatospora purpeofusca]|uniref:ABC-three component system protein n=1 Tax=Kitasatospora purpeofusca TaxID=67352 RepID=UPI00225A1154|nr:ABC-three component system protein [Kitasatospora purpeofusca]MCX4753470.1 restriction endonuclease [Kitasatospora purpeofusca]WSR32966.1 restriction endonuclease [Kitasatospora purpeofusca]